MTHIDPEKLEEAIKIAEENLGGWGPSDLRRTQRMLLDVAKAHLATLPRTKEVDVWRVEWCHPAHAMGKAWKPYAAHYLTKDEAIRKADACRNQPQTHACISVTGPHKQRLPA